MLIHTVAPGETLFSLAQRYGVSVPSLAETNGLSAEQPLAVGQALLIPYPPGETGRTRRRKIKTGGYAYSFADRGVLRSALPFMTYLWIFSYGFTEEGELIGTDDASLIALARSYGTAPLLVLTTITESGHFSSERAEKLLRSPAMRETLLTRLLRVMREKGYAGLDVDFEYVPVDLAGEYADFLRYAADLCHKEGFLFTTVAAPKTSAEQQGLLYEAHDYPVLGSLADTLFLMTYEWGYTYGPPMAVAPLRQVSQVAAYAVTEVPPQKLLLGIPNYGYDWNLPYIAGTQARSIGNEYAVRLAADRRAVIEFDEGAASPFFYYSEGEQAHVVWFEDVRSIERKFDLADRLGLAGVGYWNLQRPFAQNYALLAARYEIEKL